MSKAKKTVSHVKEPVYKKTLDMIAPVDMKEVRDFDASYGSLINSVLKQKKGVMTV